MSSVVPNLTTGPASYYVFELVKGGQVVQMRSDGLVEVADADSATVRGVALYDAAPEGTTGGAGTWGSTDNDTYDFSSLQPDVAVAWTGVFKLKAGAALNNNDLVKAGAAGTVVPIGASALSLVVGQCVEDGGVANGAVGRIRLKLA